MADIYAFLELEGIPGEAQDSKFKNKIELQSFSWGATNNSSYVHGTGGNIGKGHIHDISFSKYMCKASAELMSVLGAPSRTAMPIVDRATSVRLSATT